MRIIAILSIGGWGITIASAEDFLAVSAQVSNGYSRMTLPDGSFVPEAYIFKEGGYLSGRVADPTIDNISYAEVSRTIASALSKQNYVRAQDPRQAKLLIVLYWGTSRAPAETAAASTAGQATEHVSPSGSPEITQRGVVRFRGEEGEYAGQIRAEAAGNQMVTEEDAAMLGYASSADPDLRHFRYFVVLLAYDLEELHSKGKRKLLWQARFSMREQSHAFDRELPRLAQAASPYFGQNSLGVRHESVPEGRVEIGELKSLDEVRDSDLPAAISLDGKRVAYLTINVRSSEIHVVDVDRQSVASVDAIPNTNGQLVKVSWGVTGSLLVTFNGRPILTLDSNGNRSRSETVGSVMTPAASVPIDIRSTIEAKLLDRKIVFLGHDRSGTRYLVAATAGSGETRYFVYDAANDLLDEVGRASESP